MAKTIFITGCSSGTGLACAQAFHDAGWNVIATMRNPSQSQLVNNQRMLVLPLDVTQKQLIYDAINQGIQHFGRIDVLLNNAGYGAHGPIEAATDEEIEHQYATNVFGVMHCVRAILPHFKAQKGGKILNITSVGGLMSIPFFSLYASTKFALEGFSEGIYYELAPLGIQVKIIEPGGVRTNFFDQSLKPFNLKNFPEYQTGTKKVLAQLRDHRKYIDPQVVAQSIVAIASDDSPRLRYMIGRLPKIMWLGRRIFGDSVQMAITKKFFKLKTSDPLTPTEQ